MCREATKNLNSKKKKKGTRRESDKEFKPMSVYHETLKQILGHVWGQFSHSQSDVVSARTSLGFNCFGFFSKNMLLILYKLMLSALCLHIFIIKFHLLSDISI